MSVSGVSPNQVRSVDELWARWNNRFGAQSVRGVISIQAGDTGPTFSDDHYSRHLFPVGSVTKLVVGLCIARLLAQDSKLTVDTPVNQLLGRPRLTGKHAQRITIGHLLTHRSGYDYSDFGLNAPHREDEHRDPIDRFEPPYAASPGGHPTYSNFGVAVLGRVLEHQLGKPFSGVARDWVFTPLGLHEAAIASNDTSGSGALPLHPFFQPAGGLVLNARDGIRFASFFADPSAAPFELQEPLRAVLNPLFETPNKTIGIGMLASRFVARGLLVAGHTGSWPGHYALLLFVPEKRAALFCALSCSPRLGIETSRLWREAADLLLDTIGAPPPTPPRHTIRPYAYTSTKVPRRSPERALHLWTHQLANSHRKLAPPELGAEPHLHEFCYDGPEGGQWFVRSSQRETFVRAPFIRFLYPFRWRAALLAPLVISWPVAGWLGLSRPPLDLLVMATVLAACAVSACILLSFKALYACILAGDKRPMYLLTVLCVGVIALTIAISAGACTMITELSWLSLVHFLAFVGAAWIFSIAFLDMRIALLSVSVRYWASFSRHPPSRSSDRDR